MNGGLLFGARACLFTQEDPIGLAGGMNLYGYGAGDPINNSDPFGLCPNCRNELSSRYNEEEQNFQAALTPSDRVALGVTALAATGAGFGVMAAGANGVAFSSAVVSASATGAGLTGSIMTALQKAGPDLVARRDAVFALTKKLDVVQLKELANGALKISGGAGSRLREIYLNKDGSSVVRAFDAAKNVWRTVGTVPAPK